MNRLIIVPAVADTNEKWQNTGGFALNSTSSKIQVASQLHLL